VWHFWSTSAGAGDVGRGANEEHRENPLRASGCRRFEAGAVDEEH
jgi:hypothetical protein